MDPTLGNLVPGDMSKANYEQFDLHKHVVDRITLKASDGRPMRREADLIDVWFDSGSMPYAQWHYPFENKEKIDAGQSYPADFIAEGVDQTRGWFYTLHAIATMVFDSVAYKNVVSNGLVLDKNGQKMSKRLGNAVGSVRDLGPIRPRRDPLVHDFQRSAVGQPQIRCGRHHRGPAQVLRHVAQHLQFPALYANIDGYTGGGDEVPVADRPEIDRWVLSRLNSLIQEVTEAYEALEPTKVARAIQSFAIDDLSNWHVRQSRRRFWKGEMSDDKRSAYQTLHMPEVAVGDDFSHRTVLRRPFVPGLDRWRNPCTLRPSRKRKRPALIRNSKPAWPSRSKSAPRCCPLRKRERLRVRSPCAALVPVLNEQMASRIETMATSSRGGQRQGH